MKAPEAIGYALGVLLAAVVIFALMYYVAWPVLDELAVF